MMVMMVMPQQANRGKVPRAPPPPTLCSKSLSSKKSSCGSVVCRHIASFVLERAKSQRMQRALVVAKEFVQFVGWAHGRRPLRSLGVARPILVRVGLIRVVVDLDTRMVVYVFYGARAHRDAQTAVPALRRHACASVNGQWLGRDDGCVFYSGGV